MAKVAALTTTVLWLLLLLLLGAVAVTEGALPEVTMVSTPGGISFIREIQTIQTSVGEGQVIGGHFTIDFGGSGQIQRIENDATSEDVESALETFPGINDVRVTRSGANLRGTFAWHITFFDPVGDIEPLQLISESLTGDAATVTISEKRKGLLYSGHRTIVGNADLPNGFASEIVEPGRPGKPSASRVTAHTVKLSWDPPSSSGGSPILQYKVYQQANDEGFYDNGTLVDSAATEFLVEGLQRDTVYRWMVSARNSVNMVFGPVSRESERVLTSPKVPGRPPRPTLQGVENGYTKALASWALPTDDGGSEIKTSYVTVEETVCAIYEALPRCNTSIHALTFGRVILEAAMDSLTPSAKYRVRVEVENDVGKSEASEWSPVLEMRPLTVPTQPRDVHVEYARFTEIRIAWREPADERGMPVTSYEVQFKRSFEGKFSESIVVVAVEGGTAARAFTHTSLVPATLYYYRVAARSAAGRSEFTAELPAKTLTTAAAELPPPPPPTHVTATADGYNDSAVHLQWEEPVSMPAGSLSTYQIFFRSSETIDGLTTATWHRGVEMAATTRYNVFAGVMKEMYYQYAIAASNRGGYGKMSDPSAPFSLAGFPMMENQTGGVVETQDQGGTVTVTTTPVSQTMERTPQLLTPRGGIAELAKLINAEAHDDIRIVNAHDDDRQGLNCLEMSDRLIQSSIYVDESFGKNIKFVTIYFERMFDIPPDIEVLTTVDENTGRAFELITQQRWIDRFIVRIRRLDQHGGWNEPVKILWRAGAPSGYKCSIRGAFQQQYIMRPGRRLRIVLQSLEVLITKVSIDIFRNVTVEVDPRLTVIDPTLPPDRLALARPTITGKNLVESMFRISESNFHIFGINIVGGRGGKGGAFFVAGGLLHLSNCVVSHNNALLGGAIYLQASTLEAVETTLANNTAELTLHDGVSGGGAVYIDEEAIAIMSDSLLLGNVARAGKATSSGGAVDVWGKLRAADCVFHGNSAQGSKITAGYVSAIANGGAIACHSGGDVILERATLTNNSATTSGGLLYSIGSIVIRDSFGGNNSAPLGSNARVSMASDYIFVNTPFLHDDETLYPESLESVGSNSILVDDGRPGMILSTGP